MKRFSTMTSAAVLLAVLTGVNTTQNGFAQETNGQATDLSKYVDLAKFLSGEENDIKGAAEIASKAVTIATNNGATGADKVNKLGEVIVSQMAAVERWSEDKLYVIVKTLAVASVDLAGADGAAKVLYTRQAFATLYVVSKESGPLYNAVEAIPEELRVYAAEAIESAQSILTAPTTLAYRELYYKIRLALNNDPDHDNAAAPFIMDPPIVTVTTTTSTSTTTTTTTTGLRLDGVRRGQPAATTTTTTRPKRPTTTTTTAKSPTIVGHP